MFQLDSCYPLCGMPIAQPQLIVDCYFLFLCGLYVTMAWEMCTNLTSNLTWIVSLILHLSVSCMHQLGTKGDKTVKEFYFTCDAWFFYFDHEIHIFSYLIRSAACARLKFYWLSIRYSVKLSLDKSSRWLYFTCRNNSEPLTICNH